MELNKTRNTYYILLSLALVMLVLLGSWWLYLVFKLANKLQVLQHPLLEGNLVRMIKWEGATFFCLLLFLSITILYIYLQDYKKTKSLQGFFSSLTHELKTPLASIKLQTQVLWDLIEKSSLAKDEQSKVLKYTARLLEDGTRLEDQLDNHLQLARVERKAYLNLVPINISQFLTKEIQRYSSNIDFKIIQDDSDLNILADGFALQTVLRNLIDNSIKHTPSDKKQIIFEIKKDEQVLLIFHDNGNEFKGDINKLGTLFYKVNSPKGSGIGIYLIKKLIKQMGGDLKIVADPGLKFFIHLRPAQDTDE